MGLRTRLPRLLAKSNRDRCCFLLWRKVLMVVKRGVGVVDVVAVEAPTMQFKSSYNLIQFNSDH
jgi:hypothetical protein